MDPKQEYVYMPPKCVPCQEFYGTLNNLELQMTQCYHCSTILATSKAKTGSQTVLNNFTYQNIDGITINYEDYEGFVAN